MTEVDPTGRLARLKQLLDCKDVQYHDHELQPLLDAGWDFESRLADASVQDLVDDRVPRALAKALVKAFAAGAVSGSGLAGTGAGAGAGVGAGVGAAADATDVQQVLKTVQEQGQQLQALERQVAVLQFTSTITDKVLRYNEDNITRGSNVDFKLSLQQAYGYVYSSSGVLLTCMLSGERLPSQLVIAGHIVKHSWKDIGIHAQMGIGADDVGNGLLLFKPFEWAFDNSKLCFIYNQRFDQFDMHILDPALRARPVLEMFDAPHGFSQLVQSYVQRISKEHLAMARTTFKDKTFQDFEAHSLKLPASPRPYKRALCFHAHRVRVFALESHWVEDDWKFDDFWSEGCPTDINDWLEMQLQQVQPGQ